MPSDIAGNMDHSMSSENSFAPVPNALPPESEAAWSVSEGSGADARIVSLGCNMTGRVQGKSLTVHSAPLSNLIRDIIKIYPGQNLTGNTLVFQEPYAALMHHLPDLETAFIDMSSQGEETTIERSQLNHALATILEFLRPKFQQHFVPARERLSQERSTVRFEDLWILFKANSLAYAKVDDYWIGCKVGAATRWPADPGSGTPSRWDVAVWLLRTDWSTEKIGCATKTYQFLDFDGEMSPMDFDIIPDQLHDNITGRCGSKRKQFEERGQKILNILWGTRQYKYDGEALRYMKRPVKSYEEPFHLNKSHVKNDVFVAALLPDSTSESSWKFPFTDVTHLLSKHDPAYNALDRKIDFKKDSLDVFTDVMRFMLSPCLSALTLWGAETLLIHVDYLQPIVLPKSMPEPVLHQNQLKDILSLMECQETEGSAFSESMGKDTANGVIVFLLGGIGVGKRYIANYMSWKTGRPLITLPSYMFDYSMEIETLRFLKPICKDYNVIVMVQNINMHYTPSSTQGHLVQFLSDLNTMIFITAREVNDEISSKLQSHVNLTVALSPLDYKRQEKLWLNIMDVCHARQDAKSELIFERTISSFLSSADMPKVNWNGHDITKCLRTAISYAQLAVIANHPKDDHSPVVVKLEHLKKAMNTAYASRLATDSAVRSLTSADRKRLRPPGEAKESEDDDTSEDNMLLTFERFHEYDELSDDESPSPLPQDGKPESSNLTLRGARSRKPWLCVAELNMVEWSTFKSLGTTELFRSKRFHAIDVLVGEPQIWRELPSLLGRKRRPIPIQSVATQPAILSTSRHQNIANSVTEGALPERIRINSPAIIRAFQELQIDETSNLRGSFLLFRPYKVLSYYEKEFREWTKNLEGKAGSNIEHGGTFGEDQANDLQAEIGEMKCLLTFIDTYLKERQQKMDDSIIQSVTFDDLWFLFKPGNTVIRKNMQQAYRIIRVATTRHHIVDHEHTSLAFYKDQSLVEFQERYIFIKCVHIDFNGQLLGPVLDIFPIPEFKGEKAVDSLPVYPIELCGKPGIKEILIERGKAFAKAGGIEHMHYRGLTLPAKESSKLREEVDSQVVIDFEEAINRYPEWMPPVEKTVLEESSETGDAEKEEEWMPRFRQTQKRTGWKCIPGCCSREKTHHDESIDDKTRNRYMASQANENSAAPSAAIVARTSVDISDSFRDDDYLIMSCRVFGFVLRSRKWHQLDLAYATPAETNSDGFDSLVLPTGHKDIVTSMITKHFRDRKSASSIRTQTDIVQGKGRGLIMLLHGVPGVGKTSTAECLAGVFNRPLFQITSGDLGITAKDVDHNLEENFSLANRWNCILLIDEADVFLAQRNKEDFVQNSLVAVFLRIMEYYSGILFLTTNRVGVFDEAFSSRIHISLYYPPLDRQQTLEIFKKNWERISARSQENSRQIIIDQSEITQFAMDYFDNNKEGRWNGRQIRNAFQSALAMAEFEVLGMDDVNDDDNTVSNEQETVQTVKLGKKHFEEVAKAYKGFVDYLNKVYGAGAARRARENMWRFDPDDESASKRPTALSQRLKFTGDPMQQAPRNADPGYRPMQNPRGYGHGFENPSNYGPMTPPHGGYAGSHEYQYPPAAYAPRTHGTEQSLYPDHMRASGPSANYPQAQPQPYGTRAHPATQHEMQTSQSSWDGSSRDAQSGVYSYRPGEQNLGAATGPNIRWGGDAEASGSQQGP